jgi:membrane protease YdiL (CAAX protease family)
MQVGAALISTVLVILLVVVQPLRGRQRYERLVEQVKVDPRARARFYRQGIAAEWMLVGLVAVIGVLASMGPGSIRLWGHRSTSAEASFALLLTAVSIATVAATTVVIRRGNPALLGRLRQQVRGFVELIPRTNEERWTFAGVAVTAGICEEIVYRGFGIAYVHWLFPSAGRWVFVVLIAAAFGVAHAYQGARNILVTAILGALLTWITLATGTLVPAIAIHIAVDLRVAFLPLGITEEGESQGNGEAQADQGADPAAWPRSVAVASAIGGALLVVGAVLPWLSSSNRFGTTTQNAFQLDGVAHASYDGFVLLGCGAALLTIAAIALAGRQLPAAQRRRAALCMVLASVVALLVALGRWSGLRALTSAPSLLFTRSIGPGYWLVLSGAVVGAVASVLAWSRRSLRPAPARPGAVADH